MANMHPTPPPPGYAAPDRCNATSGSKGQSLVEYFGLTQLVREKRMQGMSYRDITNEINESHLIPNEYKISHNSIARWCRDNGFGGDMTAPTSDQIVNVYGTKVKALNLVNSAVDIVTVELDELNKRVGNGNVKIDELKAVIDMLDKLTLRQQTLSTEIGAIQEKVYRYETVEKAMNIINDILKVRLRKEDYDEVMNAFGENPLLIESLRKIAPSNV
jgi:hypothetical protein